MNNKVLYVDHDGQALAAFQRGLGEHYPVDIALGGAQGLEQMAREGPVAVIISDYQMPGMNGLEFLRHARELAPDAIRILLTGQTDMEGAIAAVNQGHLFQFLIKPCPAELLREAIAGAIRQHELLTNNRELKEHTLAGVLQTLADILVAMDPKAFAHCTRLRDEVRLFCRHLRLEGAWEVETAATFSQIGNVTLPPGLAKKALAGEFLSKEEKLLWNGVTATSAQMLSGIPRLAGAAKMVLYQNKNFDGGGTPAADPIAGKEIPLGARILRLLNHLLALEAKNVARYAAFEQMRADPKAFDPELLEQALVLYKANIESVGLESGQSIRPRAVKELRQEQVLMTDVLTLDGLVVVTAGTRLTKVMIEKIRNFADAGGVREPIFVK